MSNQSSGHSSGPGGSRPATVQPGSSKSPDDEVPAGTPQTGEDVCPRCGGSGKVDGAACPECKGSGTVIVNVGDA